MGVSPFKAAIDAVLSPLEFAARSDFAHFDRVRGLAVTVSAGCARAVELAIPKDARDLLADVGKQFADGEATPAKVTAALERLRPLARLDWAEAALARSPAVLPGVGPNREAKLAKRGIATITDLLFRLPVRYDDRRSLTKVAELTVGLRATFVATVLVSGFSAQRRHGRGRRGRTFEAVVSDETGTVRLKWFFGTDAIASRAKKNARLLVTGEVKRYRFDKELVHPEIESLPDPSEGRAGAASASSANRGREAGASGTSAAPVLDQIVPEYSSPEGLHPRALRRLIESAMRQYADLVGGHLPDSLVRTQRLPGPAEALRELHAPSPESDIEALEAGTSRALMRLVLEELYLLELGLGLRRARRGREPGIAIADAGARTRAAIAGLPFELTRAQRGAWQEISADLACPHPMSRLLEGDVGCGKTVIAFLAALAVAAAGHQSAIMAPTELLAEQHAGTLQHLVATAGAEGGLRMALLTASIPKSEADVIRLAIAAGEVDLAIGTHALLQESVAFRSLALVVIDEQHRFGVRQRAALAEKSRDSLSPHTLVMTATPIPRTLALTLHGDLDLSVIDELPPGRRPTRTLLVREGEGTRVSEALRETVERGEQVYVVYPLVEDSEKIDLRSASESAARIRSAFPDYRIDLVHGQVDAAARSEAMARFARGETQVLVSTTVIEVGVDVPNATLMIVEHAERFGLAQLHQLRGRVGRGGLEGTCICVARGVTEDSEARLHALLSTTDGFEIAEADLKIRGPGEFLGTRQSGRLPDLRIADLTRDVKQIAVARIAAQQTLARDSRLERSKGLADAVRARWGDRLALVGVG
ncbi:MAG: ATP-dependent DNA helicase RecG [Deltaproteobacteria bacterium]|nr:ATP-dependent DNA helicase RecG [Deltaproteobacteria bacterium]MBW2665994.1 ATP-dependent DNA helicase RecG [Deltaproteobacteria bacterium]